MISEEKDEFKVVKYNSRRQRKLQLKTNTNQAIVECDSVDEIISKIHAATEKFKESPFYQTLHHELKRILELLELHGIVTIVCYGLGNFSEHICSKFQLAALLSIKSAYSSDVYIYDPLFTKNEIASLEQLNLKVIETNEEGKRIINDHQPTLVFMPHCSKQLTNNFLYANWTSMIHNCILLGNSWSELECHATDALLKRTAYFIQALKPYVTEIRLKNNFHYPNTFSGTSFHIFEKEKLDTIPIEFWQYKPQVVNTNIDNEFITTQGSIKRR